MRSASCFHPWTDVDLLRVHHRRLVGIHTQHEGSAVPVLVLPCTQRNERARCGCAQEPSSLTSL